MFAPRKPVFIDKPMAASLADAMEIFRLAKEKKVPCFSSSGLRYCSGISDFRQKKSPLGDAKDCLAWSPLNLEPHHPDLFWYGIHGVETLYAIMGPGCKTVAARGAGPRGRRLGRRPRGAFVADGADTARSSTGPRAPVSPARSRAASRWWWRLFASSARASRRLPRKRPSKSSLSWRPPTRASVKASAGEPPERDAKGRPASGPALIPPAANGNGLSRQ